MVSAQCSAVSWISTLEVLTWPFLTMRMRSLRVKPITSVDSGQTTSSTQVSPALNTNYMDSVLWSQAHPNISIHLHSRGILVIYIYIIYSIWTKVPLFSSDHLCENSASVRSHVFLCKDYHAQCLCVYECARLIGCYCCQGTYTWKAAQRRCLNL